MPLETYTQVRPWAAAIKKAVLGKRMPPWFAVKGFGAFRNDLSASQEDITVISSWVEGGAPKGDSTFLPSLHKHPNETADADDERAATTVSIAVVSGLTLEHEAVVAAIRPESVPEGGSLQAVAHRPDGSVEHLLWVQGFDPRWRRVYVFARPFNCRRERAYFLRPKG